VAEPYPRLFAGHRLRSTTLRNRIVSTAHGTNLAAGGRQSETHLGTPGDALREYHLRRARGGVGMIITEPAAVFPFQPEAIHGWAPVVEAVHGEGVVILDQLAYGGRQVSGAETLRPTYAPSALPWQPGGEYPREMSVEHIRLMVGSFAATARAAIDTGFDGVEVHGGHGYLVHGFLSPVSNRRDDDYGGDPVRRRRFALEVVAAVRDAIGDDHVLGIRLSAVEHVGGGIELEDTLATLAELTSAGLIDYVNVSAGSYQAMHRIIPGMYGTRAQNALSARAVKDAFPDLTVLLAGRVVDPVDAEALLADGTTDLVAMTRALIADPDLPRKAHAGNRADIRFCMGINQGCWGRVRAGFAVGCVLNPEAGRERDLLPAPPRSGSRMLVVGGGPGGGEAARRLALAGHDVTLWEAAPRLGGRTAVAARAPMRADLGEVARWFGHELDRLGVTVELGRHATAADVAAFDPAAVVLAVGAAPAAAPFALRPDALTLLDALDRDYSPIERVVIYSVSDRIDVLSVADRFASDGARVTLATPHGTVGTGVDDATRPEILGRLAAHDVTIVPSVSLVAGLDEIVVASVFDGRETRLGQPDRLVVDLGWTPRLDLARELAVALPDTPVELVGDCLAPRGIQAAVLDGARAAERLAVRVGRLSLEADRAR
jgi:2,4-dienoyl-CoA reductase-like NADH-dependent reductase (Old Yellow Enzyme family)